MQTDVKNRRRKTVSPTADPMIDLILYLVVVVKRIAALRAEFWRILRVGRIPAALVALVKRLACRTFRAAPLAEITLIHRAA